MIELKLYFNRIIETILITNNNKLEAVIINNYKWLHYVSSEISTTITQMEGWCLSALSRPN